VQILGHEQGLIVIEAFDTADGVVTIPPAGAREGQIVKVQKIEPLTSLEDADVGE